MKGKSVVALVPCPDYEGERVAGAVARGFELLEPEPLPTGKPVLLKPNMLRPSPPEKGVTTHPSVFSAVARFLREKVADLVFGDSPNGIFAPQAAAERSGLAAEARALGIPLADFETEEEVRNPSGSQNRRFVIARGIVEAGAIVNLPRLKTHSLTTITGALKNIFGAVPGKRKAEFHIKHPDVEGFSRMIADLNGLVRSRLVVMDAIRAMEGNGPSAGDLVDLGLLLFSTDPVAVDAVCCRIVGVDPLSLPLIRIAQEIGVGNASPDAIEIRGARLADHARARFAVPPRSLTEKIPGFLYRIAKDLLVAKPIIDDFLCVRCGECVKTCPTQPKALSQEPRNPRQGRGAMNPREYRGAMNPREYRGARNVPSAAPGGIPRYDYSLCIRCYCCQETCPEGAISVQDAPLGGIFRNRK